ncbi:MAG: hypothetical protein WDM76_17000 [Limisphaerales bacterium]
MHTASVSYSDSIVGQQTNVWSFNICQYQNVNLPAPIYLETFDEVPEAVFQPVGRRPIIRPR